MQYQYLPSDQAQLQVDNEDIKRKQQMAQAFQQAGFNPVQGGNQILSLIASMASTLRGNSLMKDASKSLSENLTKEFEMRNQADQAKAEAEQRTREEDFQRELQKLRAGEQYKAEFREPEKVPFEQQLFNMLPENLRGQAALGKFGLGPKAGQATPDYLQKLQAAEAMGIQLSPEERKQLVTGLKPDASEKPRALPADMAGKVALADEYLANFDQIAQSVKAGDLTGISDSLTAKAGYGKGGEVMRKIKSGRDALQRTLTGAGMPASEADEYADRYLPTVGDTAETLLSKQAQLRSELTRFSKIARADQSYDPNAQTAQPSTQSQPTQTATNPQTGQKIGLINGQWVPI